MTLRLSLLSLLLVSSSLANPQAIERGAAYLASRVQALAADTTAAALDTQEALIALQLAGGDADVTNTLYNALAAAELTADATTQVAIQVALGTATPAKLLALQNADGGWGASAGKQSDPFHTVLALEITMAAGAAPAAGWVPTANLLLNQRQADNRWIHSDESEGQSEASDLLTAIVLRGLKALDIQGALTPAQRDAIAPSVTLLQITDHTDVLTQVEVYRALALYLPPGVLIDHLSDILSAQDTDGSWGSENVDFTTARAVQALHMVRPPVLPALPDLMIIQQSIQFDDPNDLLSVVILNRGTAAASDGAGLKVTFYDGDPRTGGTALGSNTSVTSLESSSSALLTVPYTGSVTDLYVQVDPDGVLADADPSNNLAWLDLANPAVQGASDLLVLSTGILANGQPDGANVSVAGSPTVELMILVGNLGDQASGDFSLSITDTFGADTSLTGSLSHAALDAREGSLVRVPWVPSVLTGSHVIEVTIVPQGADNAANNVASATFHITGGVPSVTAASSYNAYDSAVISVLPGLHTDATASVHIEQADGTHVADLVYDDVADQAVWGVGNTAPGTYRAVARFASSEGVELETVNDAFTVAQTIDVLTPYLSLGAVTEFDGEDDIDVSVLLRNRSNVGASWDLTWDLIDIYQQTVATSAAATTMTFSSASVPELLDTLTIPAGTLDGGYFTMNVTATNGATAREASIVVSVVPELHLKVENLVTPQAVPPLDQATVTNVVRLTAIRGEASLLPVSIDSIVATPDGSVADESTSTVTLVGTGVRNSLGELVTDGYITVFLPYLTLVSPDPGTCSCTTTNAYAYKLPIDSGGNLTLTVHPDAITSPQTLATNETGFTVIEFRQRPSEADWFGKTIDSFEFVLTGQTQ